MKSVSVVGSINIDLTNYLDRWPGIGETVTVRDTTSSLGGKGANQAIAAARLGAQVTLVGAIGKDGFGQDAGHQLRKSGIRTRLVEVHDVATGLAFIDVGPESDNIIRLSRGANGVIAEAHVEMHAIVIRESGVVLLQNEIGLAASLAAARFGRNAGALVIMDPAPAPVPVWDRSVFSCFDILTPNAHEAGNLLGRQPETLAEAQLAANDLREFGLRGAIVTMGEQGVAWSFDGSTGTLPAYPVSSVDTVAAGDCFNGALATGLTRGEDIGDAVAFAMRAAAIATTRKGASVSLPTLREVEEAFAPVSA